MKAVFQRFNQKKQQTTDPDQKPLPRHVAIIMDGNGRWAKARQLPRAMGHRAGTEALRDVIRTASDIGLEYLTLYAFSTENWKRPAEEVNGLMQLLVEYMKKEVKGLHENRVKILTIGDLSRLPQVSREAIEEAMELTKENQGLQLVFALNYGGRDELLRGVRRLAEQVRAGTLLPEEINEEQVNQVLDTAAFPEPELLIRTSGEYRLSNFMLWQTAYTEFFFESIYWPDFTGSHLLTAIRNFQNRNRRYGGIE